MVRGSAPRGAGKKPRILAVVPLACAHGGRLHQTQARFIALNHEAAVYKCKLCEMRFEIEQE